MRTGFGARLRRNIFAAALFCVLFAGACVVAFLFTKSVMPGGQVTTIDEAVVRAQKENPPAAEPALRIAVGAMISPKDTASYYGRLIRYIGRKTGTGVELVQRKTYAEINEMLASGDIDIAFICSGPYALAQTPAKPALIATPQVQGSHRYYSYFIVHKDSPFHKVEELEGRRFAFTDPDSNTGCWVPRYWLARHHTTPEKFFGKTIFTYSHDNSIMAVARGLVDGASVDSFIWDYYARRQPELTDKTRIIYKSQGFGIPPVVASMHVSEAVRKKIQDTLTAMHDDPEGAEILRNLMIDRFVVSNDAWYASIRDMYASIRASEDAHALP